MWQDLNEFLAGGRNVYLFIAVAGSVVLALQFILSMTGLHADVDADPSGVDFDVNANDVSDVAGLNFFSLKAIIWSRHSLKGTCCFARTIRFWSGRGSRSRRQQNSL